MGFSLPGQVGAGAQDALAELLARRMQEQQMQQQQEAQRIAQALQQAQLAQQIKRDEDTDKDRAENRAYRGRQEDRQSAVDLIGQLAPGELPPDAAATIKKYPGTAGRVSSRQILQGVRPVGDAAPLDASGPQDFSVLEPTPEQSEKAFAKSERKRIIGGLNPRERRAQELGDVGVNASVINQTLRDPQAELQELAAQREIVESTAAKYRPKPQGGAGGHGLSGMGALYEQVNPDAIAEGIMRGEIPPDISQFGRPASAAVASSLAAKGVNLQEMQRQWTAVKRHIQTLNGTQMVRLQQVGHSIVGTAEKIEELINQWDASGFPAINKAKLAAAQQGVLGPKAQVAATQLHAYITDLQAEIAVLYRSGLAPTDSSIDKAEQNLKTEWSMPQLRAGIEMIKTQTRIRLNAVQDAGPIGFNTPGGRYGMDEPTPRDEAPALTPYQMYLQRQRGGG
jgi:hypothetical protein